MEKTIDLELEFNDELDDIKIMLYNFIKNNNGVSRQEINDYMYPLFDISNKNELNNKTRYIITFLKEKKLILNKGTKNKPKWIAIK